MMAENARGLTYAQAGVDIDAGNRMVELIKPLVRATARAGADAEIGGFGGLFDLKRAGFTDPVLVAATDGVGTKVKIAIETGRHDTIGIDLVAMSVNDLVVQGAEPLFFLDYYACGQLDAGDRRRRGRRHRGRLPRGRLRADRRRDRGNARPLSAAAITISPALRSARPSAARCCRAPTSPRATSSSGSPPPACIPTAIRWCARWSRRAGLPGARPRLSRPTQTLGEAMLTPTRIYVKSCLAAIRATKAVKGLAHITGGGFPDNIPRVLPEGPGRAHRSARKSPCRRCSNGWRAKAASRRTKCCAPSTAASA